MSALSSSNTQLNPADSSHPFQNREWKVRLNAYERLSHDVKLASPNDESVWLTVRSLSSLLQEETHPTIISLGLKVLEMSLDRMVTWAAFVDSFCTLVLQKCNPKRDKESCKNILFGLYERGCWKKVLDALAQGSQNKDPKKAIVANEILTDLIRTQDIEKWNVNEVMPVFLKSLNNRDKTVRESAKALLVQLGLKFGTAFESKLVGVRAQLINEIMSEVRSTNIGADCQTTTVNEKQPAKALVENAKSQESVDVLTRIPTDIEQTLQSKEWKVRLNAVYSLTNIFEEAVTVDGKSPMFATFLNNIIDTLSAEVNVTVLLALVNLIRCIAQCATKKARLFDMLLSTLLLKFKDKRQNLIAAISDAMFPLIQNIGFDSALVHLVEGLEHKWSGVTAQTALIVSRYFIEAAEASSVSPKHIKQLLKPLIKLTDSKDLEVKCASLKALSALATIHSGGEIASSVDSLSSDKFKMNKIKQYKEQFAALLAEREPKPRKSVAFSSADNVVVSIPKRTESSGVVYESPVKPPRTSTPQALRELLLIENSIPDITELNSTYLLPSQRSRHSYEKKLCFKIVEESRSYVSSENSQSQWCKGPPSEAVLEELKGKMEKVCMPEMFHLLWDEEQPPKFSQALDRLTTLLQIGDLSFMANRQTILRWCMVKLYKSNTSQKISLFNFLRRFMLSYSDDPWPYQSQIESSLVHLLRMFKTEDKKARRELRLLFGEILLVYPYFELLPHLLSMCEEAEGEYHLAELINLILHVIRVGPLRPDYLQTILTHTSQFVSDNRKMVKNVALNVIVYILTICPTIELDNDLTDDEIILVEQKWNLSKSLNYFESVMFARLDNDYPFEENYPSFKLEEITKTRII